MLLCHSVDVKIVRCQSRTGFSKMTLHESRQQLAVRREEKQGC